ncbi:MAG: Uma2 family endonuclease [Planctomycetota bacterium]
MSAVLAPSTILPDSLSDPFYYGWRDVASETPDGKWVIRREPLTLEDCLHPQMGDVILESSLHAAILTYLSSVFRDRLAGDETALVLRDTGIFWDDLEIRHHSPDVAVIFGVREKRVDWSSFYVAEQQTRPKLIIEVVSPKTRENDVDRKVDQYHQVRVPIYVIVDRIGDDWRLIGYQWTPTEYLPMPTDKEGRLWLEPVGLWLGLKSDGVVLYDGATGRAIGDYSQVSKERDVETERADAEAERANAEAERRLAAEARIRELEEQLKQRPSNPPS